MRCACGCRARATTPPRSAVGAYGSWCSSAWSSSYGKIDDRRPTTDDRRPPTELLHPIPRSTHHSPGFRACHLAVADDRDAVHQHVDDTHGDLVRPLVRRAI